MFGDLGVKLVLVATVSKFVITLILFSAGYRGPSPTEVSQKIPVDSG